MRETLLQHLVAPGSPGPARPLVLESFAHSDGHIIEGILHDGHGNWWWIADGVPRLLPPTMYRSPALEARYSGALKGLGLAIPSGRGSAGGRLNRIQSRTIDRFGHEWRVFKDWGFHDDAAAGDDPAFRGGRWSDTQRAFRSKTLLDGLIGGATCLDAGCGNGRFCAAALEAGAARVIGVDIGWGVDAAFERHRDDPRVHIVQASLFDLPIAGVDAAFSIGVLMHTGDAARAFRSVAAAVVPGGLVAVRMYHRGNWAYEVVDRSIRAVTTRLGKGAQMRIARGMAALGRRLDGARGRRWYRILRNWPTVHHNLDWWTAPVATHHTSAEVISWGRGAGLELVRADPPANPGGYGFWEWPEALTVLFERPLAVNAQRPPPAWRDAFAGVAAG